MGNGMFGAFTEFVLNGGLFGKERGFDRRKEGHIYSVNECQEDLGKHLSCIKQVLGVWNGILYGEDDADHDPEPWK